MNVCYEWTSVSKQDKVYVHCHQGNSRLVSTVNSYLHYKGMAFEDACELIVKIKPRNTHNGEMVESAQRHDKRYL